MNCQEVQSQLSDYVDVSLSAARLGLVEEHLAACSTCREEAELLGESAHAVAALPRVETPLGFSQRVMSHVREIETQPSLWQRFFLPLNSKLPAQATAVVIVGFLGFYLLKKEQPQQLTALPETTSAVVSKQESAPQTTNEPGASETPEVAALEQQGPRIATLEQRLQSAVQGETPRRIEKPASPPTHSLPDSSFATPKTTEPALRTTPIVSAKPLVNPSSVQPAGGVSTFSVPSETESTALRATPATIEPFADLELILRRHAAPPASDSVSGLRKAEVSQGAAPRPLERLMAAIPDRTQPQTIWINVPQDQYEQFKKELQTLGIIESETRVPLLRDQAANQDGHIRVKLTALPAGENATSNPATGR